LENKKRLQIIFAMTSIICMLIMLVSYISSIIKGNTEPTLMTWLFFCIAVTLSFITYMKTKKHSLLNNIANFVDLGFVGLITTTIISVIIYKHIRIKINVFDSGCIFLVLLILIFWFKTKNHSKANIFLQVLMVVAYFPMIYHLWNTSKNIEPLGPWFINLVAGFCYVLIAFLGKDKLAKIYAIRMVTMLSIVIFLIMRIKFF